MPVGTPRVLTRAEITWRPNLGTCPSICIWRITLTAHALHTLSKRAGQAKLLQQLLASPPPAAPLSGRLRLSGGRATCRRHGVVRLRACQYRKMVD